MIDQTPDEATEASSLLAMARTLYEQHLAQARKEAEEIVNAAKSEAERIVGDAHNEEARLSTSITQLKEFEATYRASLRSYLSGLISEVADNDSNQQTESRSSFADNRYMPSPIPVEDSVPVQSYEQEPVESEEATDSYEVTDTSTDEPTEDTPSDEDQDEPQEYSYRAPAFVNPEPVEEVDSAFSTIESSPTEFDQFAEARVDEDDVELEDNTVTEGDTLEEVLAAEEEIREEEGELDSSKTADELQEAQVEDAADSDVEEVEAKPRFASVPSFFSEPDTK